MLTTILAGVILVGLLFAAMAIGSVLFGKPIRGSCGGVGAGQCEGCGGKPGHCRNGKHRDSFIGK